MVVGFRPLCAVGILLATTAFWRQRPAWSPIGIRSVPRRRRALDVRRLLDLSADDVVSPLAQRQPVAGVEVLTLGEHVDYWDRLGWRDPF
jgi:Protein of unknown function (DUF1223)